MSPWQIPAHVVSEPNAQRRATIWFWPKCALTVYRSWIIHHARLCQGKVNTQQLILQDVVICLSYHALCWVTCAHAVIPCYDSASWHTVMNAWPGQTSRTMHAMPYYLCITHVHYLAIPGTTPYMVPSLSPSQFQLESPGANFGSNSTCNVHTKWFVNRVPAKLHLSAFANGTYVASTSITDTSSTFQQPLAPVTHGWPGINANSTSQK